MQRSWGYSASVEKLDHPLHGCNAVEVVTVSGSGSVVVRRQLGVRLRRLREAARKELADVVESGIGSKAKISRIENGRLPVRMADVRALCWLYGADPATTDALAALAPGTQADDWWEQHGQAVVPDWFGLYVGLEAAASRIRGFEPERVQGLLQTPEYAAAVFGSDPRTAADVAAQRVQFRMERQRAVFDDGVVPKLTAVVGEGALRCGPPEVMRAQVAHLHELSRRPEVDVRVLAFAAGLYPLRSSFTLLDFADPEDPPVVYLDVRGSTRYLEKPADLAEYEYVFDLIAGKSVPIEEWQT